MSIDLEAIRQRADAATPGPWKQGGRYDGEWTPMGQGCGGVLTGETGFYVAHAPNYHYADAEFVAHAREDVPALLVEVERLRGTIAHAMFVGAPPWDGDQGQAVYTILAGANGEAHA